MIPSVYTTKDKEACDRLAASYNEAIKRKDIDEAHAYMQETESIGTFTCQFAHDNRAEAIELYPTLPNDIANLLKILDIFYIEFQK